MSGSGEIPDQDEFCLVHKRAFMMMQARLERLELMVTRMHDRASIHQLNEETIQTLCVVQAYDRLWSTLADRAKEIEKSGSIAVRSVKEDSHGS